MEHKEKEPETEIRILAIKDGRELIQNRVIYTSSKTIEENLNKSLDALLW